MREGIITTRRVITREAMVSAVDRGHLLDMIRTGIREEMAHELVHAPLDLEEERDILRQQTIFTAKVAVMSPERFRALRSSERELSAAHADRQAAEVACARAEARMWGAEAELQLLKADLKELTR